MKDLGYQEVSEGYRKGYVSIYKKQVPGLHASMAIDFIVRWGMVAAVPDGEDSAGRSKSRLATPDELINRACEVSEIAVREFEKRDWLLNLPKPGVHE